MRFLHTADWQVGMRAAHVGTAGEQVREARFAAAERVVAVAREHGAEFMVLAGDTFEDNAVDRRLVRRVGELLLRFGGPVYLLPGNHDRLEPGSVWEHEVWSRGGLHVLRDDAPVDLPGGGRLHPTPLREKRSRIDPTTRIDASVDTGITVGVSHGSMLGVVENDTDHPIARDAATRAGVDYLAIGHWHSTSDLAQAARQRIAYPGTHEQTKFGEARSGNVLIVDIAERGAAPVLEQVPTGALRWLQLRGDVSELREPGDLERFIDEHVDAVAKPGSTLLDIALHGVLRPDEAPQLDRLHEIVDARGFLYSRIDGSRLYPPPHDDAWLGELDGIVRQAAEHLWRVGNGRGAETPFPELQPDVARAALLELFALRQEVQR